MVTMKVGEKATIKDITAPAEMRSRLSALGIVAGKEVELIRKAIFSGPLHIRLGTTDIIIRQKDADHIRIQK